MNSFHAYTKLSELGLSDGATVNDILANMAVPALGFFYVFNGGISGLPITTQANLIVYKAGTACDIVERSIWTGESYFGKYGGANIVESWIKI